MIETNVGRLEAIWRENHSEGLDHSAASRVRSSAGRRVVGGKRALTVQTRKYTGRSPNDRFIVRDRVTNDTVEWEA